MCTTSRLAVLVAAVHVILAAPAPSSAATYLVAPDGSGDYATIQDAVDASVNGGTILLADGTFIGEGNRDIDYNGLEITVRSQSGDPAMCIIDCGGSELDPHRGFHFHSGEGVASVLQGITIENGYIDEAADASGGGIYIDASSPTIDNCVISGCSVISGVMNCRGGGIAIRNAAAPTITDCTVSGNTCGVTTNGYGGGVHCHQAAVVTMSRCTITENTGSYVGGGVYAYYVDLIATDCWVSGNSVTSMSPYAGGGGLLCGNGASQFTGCTFVGNSAERGAGMRVLEGTYTNCTVACNTAGVEGGGTYCETATPVFVNTIVAFNTGGGIFNEGMMLPVPELSCCDVYGNVDGDYTGGMPDQTGEDGNFSEDPRFCGISSEVLTLCSNSPCLPAGNGCGVLIGAHDTDCGDCDSLVEDASWGAIKAMFR